VSQKTPEQRVRRFVELHALGASQAEAARAVEISIRVGQRALQDPENRKLFEKLRHPAEDSGAAVRKIVQGMLDDDDVRLQQKAAEWVLPYPTAFKELPNEDPIDTLQEGCFIVYPRRDENSYHFCWCHGETMVWRKGAAHTYPEAPAGGKWVCRYAPHDAAK
jgi:hypothetical protein